MYAFSLSPFPLLARPSSLRHTSFRVLPIRSTRFRGISLPINPTRCEYLHSCRQIQIPKCFSDPPDDDEDNEDEEDVEIILTDPQTNRTLSAGVEHSIANKGKTYLLCHPIDDPVTFARASDTGLLDPVEDDALLQKMFPNAEAVLAEEHVVLKNSAYFMTVDDQSEDIGDGDEDDEEDEDEDEDEGRDGHHQKNGDEQDVEIIGEFLHEGVQHFVVRPMDAVLLVAEELENGYRVLEGTELQQVSPVIEEFIESMPTAA